MKTTIKVKGLKPSVDVFTQKLHDKMTKLWNDATRAFLEEMLKEDTMLIDTGMSRASLLPIARKVRMLTVARAKINPRSAPKKGAMVLDGASSHWDKSLTQGPELGEKLGESAFTLNYGTTKRPVFKFEFRIVVYQHWAHETFGNVPNSYGKESVAKGQEAFLEYIKQNAQSAVPQLADWIFPETT